MINIFTTGMMLTIFLSLYAGVCYYFAIKQESHGWKKVMVYQLLILSGSSAIMFGFYYQFEFIYPAHIGHIMVYNDDSVITGDFFYNEVMTSVPPELYYNLDRLILTRDMSKPKNFFKMLKADKRLVDGDYFPQTDSLRVKEHNVNRMKEIWTHEIGHKYFYERMTEEQRNEWRIISNNSILYPTMYSRTNADEDFAEHFMCFFVLRTCTTDEEKINFFITNVLELLQIDYEIRKSKGEYFYIVEQLEFEKNQTNYPVHIVNG